MKNIKIGLVLLLGVLLLVSGCATLQQFVKTPEITYDSLSVQDVSLAESTLVFHLNAANPNPVGIRLDSLTYNLKVNDKDLISGVLDKGVSLAANGATKVSLPVTLDYFKVFDSVSDFMSAENLAWDLSGTFQVMGFQFPYHADGELPVPRLPKIALDKIEVSALSFSGASLVFCLGVQNDNAFDLNFSGLDFNIKVGGLQLADGRTANLSPIRGQSKSTLRLPVNISFKDLGMSAYSLLKNSSSDYELSGALTIAVPSAGKKAVPFSKTGRVGLSR